VQGQYNRNMAVSETLAGLTKNRRGRQANGAAAGGRPAQTSATTAEKPKTPAQGTHPPLTTFVDRRDDRTYKAVTIGYQTWMAENLNYDENGSKCYANNSAACDKYGRLYNLSQAKRACPAGWHLPSDAEWAELMDYVGDSLTAGTRLKASEGWRSKENVPAGTDDYLFSALPGGAGNINGNSFDKGGIEGYWWSATAGGRYHGHTWYRNLNEDSKRVKKDSFGDNGLFSVRCVQDVW